MAMMFRVTGLYSLGTWSVSRAATCRVRGLCREQAQVSRAATCRTQCTHWVRGLCHARLHVGYVVCVGSRPKFRARLRVGHNVLTGYVVYGLTGSTEPQLTVVVLANARNVRLADVQETDMPRQRVSHSQHAHVMRYIRRR
jgi:hypothetical protein